MFPFAVPWGNIEILGKQNELFPSGPVVKCLVYYTKHLTTGPKGNSSFCFPRISMFPQGTAKGNIEVRGKQNELFPSGPVNK